MGNQQPSTFEERLYFLVLKTPRNTLCYHTNFLMVKVRRLSKPRQMAEGSRVGEQG